jgi:hypothetical protein
VASILETVMWTPYWDLACERTGPIPSIFFAAR